MFWFERAEIGVKLLLTVYSISAVESTVSLRMLRVGFLKMRPQTRFQTASTLNNQQQSKR